MAIERVQSSRRRAGPLGDNADAGRVAPGRALTNEIVDTLPVGMFRSTVDGAIVHANPMFLRVLDYPDLQTLRTRRAADLYVNPEDRAQWLVEAAGSEVVTDFESRLRRFDGSTLWARTSGRIVRCDADEADQFECLIVDITQRKLAEAQQAQRTAELAAFYELSRRLRVAPTVHDMYPLIVEQAMTLLGAFHACLALLNPERQVFTRVCTAGLAGEESGSTFPSHGTRSGQVVDHDTPFVSDDYGRELLPAWMVRARYRDLGPLIVVPVRSQEEILGTLCAARVKGGGSAPFTQDEVRLLAGIAEIAGISIQRARLHQHLQDANVQMVIALAHLVETRDSYTGQHCQRVVSMAERVARRLGCSAEELTDIRWGARLHDIGKVGIPDALLRKPGPLTDQEWAVMRQHPLLGEDILSAVQRMRGAAKLVRHHQEAWNGSGYPDGLAGDAIPLGARILAVVDAFGAITETRPYREARTDAEAVAEIRRCAGGQFDPRVVAAFCATIDEHMGEING